MKRKINDNMDIYEVYEVMCENNLLAEIIVNDLLKATNDIDRNFQQLITLDKRNIRGNKIVKLYEYCSNSDINKFYLTILALCFINIYTDEEIMTNLNSRRPVPFIRDEDVNCIYLNPINRLEFYKKVLENKENVISEINARKRKKHTLIKNNI